MARKRPRKQRRRKLFYYEYVPVIYRLRYLCDVLFGGDSGEMAFSLNLCSRELGKIFRGEIRATIRFLAHVSATLDICPEWLLCGSGPVYRTPYDTAGIELPVKLHSSFRLFDTVGESVVVAQPNCPIQIKSDEKIVDLSPYLVAGKAFYTACSNHQSIGFFLGSSFLTALESKTITQFYAAGFADVLVVSLEYAFADAAKICPASHIDINMIAKFAANRGIGYGEAICTAAFSPAADRTGSVIATLHDMGHPVLVTAEIGELATHTAPALHGAELGAAIGAATYVDLLVLTEQLKTFFAAPGGVFVLAGNCQRGLRLILQRMASLDATVANMTGFTFVVFSSFDSDTEKLITHFGGHVIFLNNPTTAAFTQLFQTCNDVYAGKI